MTRDESIALYERAQAAEKLKRGEGRKVWNAWAEGVLGQKADLASSGEWENNPSARRAWSEAAAVNFLQSMNQEFQINHRRNHAEEPVAVTHRGADQHYCPGRLSASHHQRLAVVYARIACSRVGLLEFSLQKCVRLNAAGGDSLAFRVQQRGIVQIAG